MFDPPLPEAKRLAIQRLGFGPLDKVVLKFDKPFWTQQFDMRSDMLGIAGKNQPVSDLVNSLRFTDVPLLIGLRGGANARAREADRRSHGKPAGGGPACARAHRGAGHPMGG